MKVLMYAAVMWICGAYGALAGLTDHKFANIDGGTLDLSNWEGQPILVVNTASQCAFTGQYRDLQTLYDRYKSRGLIVLAVPSDDFNQELATSSEVKEFCELTFGIDMPMADITHVRGARAHSFYAQVQNETGFVPRWNFAKILISPDGTVVGTWGSSAKPLSESITGPIEALLN